MSKSGDVILVPFPLTNLSSQKVRPAVQLTNATDDDVIICAISTKKHSVFDIRITPNQINGLKSVSYIRTNKIATMEKRLVLAKLGNVDAKQYQKVKEKIQKIFKI